MENSIPLKNKVVTKLQITDWNGQICSEGDTICIEMPEMRFNRDEYSNNDIFSSSMTTVIYTRRNLIGTLKFRLSSGMGIIIREIVELDPEPSEYSVNIGSFRRFKHTKYKWYKV